MTQQQTACSSVITSEQVLETLRNYPNLFEKFSIKTLALFGSTAHNQATATSDLDFVVEFQNETTLSLYMDLKFFLEELFNKPVDLATKKSLKEIIREQVLNEAKYV
ncbi:MULTISPECIES: nucleotidyltransferase family protein [unclassified Picosynechococcus]|uniref:nucleotidyltransferase family protein n=1 Tax=unclassified Picosynechococcus TaxID=3079910 RepID=UPI0004AB24B1|nr:MULTISPECIES: nucleotidyltransferase family protein [unclassified Picosynechococcus]AMA10859.1 nucleotidyltransferase [Picosynechococcus sp. PCC 73109]